jgi:GNAT superfamily N-acetyltransferase
VTGGFTIVDAEPEHLPALPRIELAAARLLVPHAPTSVLEETTCHEVFREAQRERRLWVALGGRTPIGFALAEMLGDRSSHLQEMDVAPRHGRQGVGTALVAEVLRWARRSGHAQTTLTTFRAVPWNMPFYRNAGFEEMCEPEWSAELKDIVARENDRGLLKELRCVMRCRP